LISKEIIGTQTAIKTAHINREIRLSRLASRFIRENRSMGIFLRTWLRRRLVFPNNPIDSSQLNSKIKVQSAKWFDKLTILSEVEGLSKSLPQSGNPTFHF
jgi:hypothetical protein